MIAVLWVGCRLFMGDARQGFEKYFAHEGWFPNFLEINISPLAKSPRMIVEFKIHYVPGRTLQLGPNYHSALALQEEIERSLLHF
jgi:hypothetical protein